MGLKVTWERKPETEEKKELSFKDGMKKVGKGLGAALAIGVAFLAGKEYSNRQEDPDEEEIDVATDD